MIVLVGELKANVKADLAKLKTPLAVSECEYSNLLEMF